MTDLISRQAAIDVVEHITSNMSVCVNSDECHGMKRMQRQAVIELENLPFAQPEQKKGAWEMDVLDGTPGYRPVCIVCSECHAISFAEFPYCPNCGTQML